MGQIAVYHDDVTLGGGGEDVCMTALDALAETHDVTLFTRPDPELQSLNRYFDTAVSEIAIETAADAGYGTRALAEVGRITNQLAGRGLAALRRAAFAAYTEKRCREFDALVDTCGEELAGAVTYKHKPLSDEERYKHTLRLTPGDAGEPERLLANSAWTANQIEAERGVSPKVIYPPVNTAEFGDPLPWEERERGFVTVGRTSPEKRTLELIEVIRRVRERGHDVHLHVVGPAHNGAYAARVEATAAETDGVTYEGAVSRERLVEFLESHRYGLHGRRPEHFGISVAEMVAAGALPVVPDAGGQREIVTDPRLRYDSVTEAVAHIEALLEAPDRQAELRESLPDVEEQFGRERFARAIRDVVADELSRQRPVPSV